jgi:hypothetical protein
MAETVVKWTKKDNMIMDAYVILIIGGRRTLEQADVKYHEEIKLRIAEKTLELLDVK